MKEETKELIKKWQLTSALRGISLFDDNNDDYEVAELLDQLQQIEDARNERNPHQQCADELFRLGLNYHDYLEYSEMIEAERDAAKEAEIKLIEESNKNIQDLRDYFKCVNTSGAGSSQTHHQMHIPTVVHGTIKVNTRIVRISWNRIRVWKDYVLPNKTKVHEKYESTWHTEFSKMNRGFPNHWWTGNSSSCGRNNIELSILWNLANSIKAQYDNPVVKVKRTKKKENTNV